MEGLEIKVGKFSNAFFNKDFRIDSQFYTKEITKNPNLNYSKIGNFLKKAQYGISIGMNENKIGYPIYRMNEIHNGLCDTEVLKYADISQTELKIFTLNDRDILFNRTNSFEWVGRTGLYRKIDSRNFVFASYLVRLIPDYKVLFPEYLTAFLNSKFGINDIKRRARQSINQTNVNPEEVKEIEIPLLSLTFQNTLKDLYENAHKKRKISQDIYSQAENLLLETLGLKDFKPGGENVNVKSFSESFGSSGRLDAEYYQKKYEDVILKMKGNNYSLLGDLVNIKKSIEPGSSAYSDVGLPFLRVADYNKFGISKPQKCLSESYCKENAGLISRLKPEKGTILFSKDGSVGTAFTAKEKMDLVTSGAILHLTVKNCTRILPEYLTLVLNSQLVQMQAERDAGGSIILHWRISEIENVIIPVVEINIQQKISGLIEESFRLKQQSEQLLGLAKTAVEKAIEQGEGEAEDFIHKSLNHDFQDSVIP